MQSPLTLGLVIAIGIAIDMYGGRFVSSAQADVIFHDDFSDSNFEDGSPVTWVPFVDAHFDASSGDLSIQRSLVDNGGVIGVPEIDLRDVSLRVQSRIEGATTPQFVQIYARGDRTIGQAIGGRLVVCADGPRASTWQGGGQDWCVNSVAVDIDPSQNDVVLQLDVFDSTASFWVWSAGVPKPDEPAVILDVTFDSGEVGLVYDEDSFDGHGFFRYVRLEDSPIEDVQGDFNFDFQLDATDIDLLSAEILGPQPRDWFDLTGDGEVKEEDRRFWVESLAGTFFGDTDLNGKVEFADFLALSDGFGQAGGWSGGDFDGSGSVEFADFLRLSTNFGNTRAIQAVPEPRTGIMGITAWLLMVYHGRRRSRAAQELSFHDGSFEQRTENSLVQRMMRNDTALVFGHSHRVINGSVQIHIAPSLRSSLLTVVAVGAR